MFGLGLTGMTIRPCGALPLVFGSLVCDFLSFCLVFLPLMLSSTVTRALAASAVDRRMPNS